MKTLTYNQYKMNAQQTLLNIIAKYGQPKSAKPPQTLLDKMLSGK